MGVLWGTEARACSVFGWAAYCVRGEHRIVPHTRIPGPRTVPTRSTYAAAVARDAWRGVFGASTPRQHLC
eukprot:2943466-Prymnesium_polylepis.1